jgi:hypothetical protein
MPPLRETMAAPCPHPQILPPLPLRGLPHKTSTRDGARLADSPLIDLTTLSSKAIRRLTDDELTPVLQQGFWGLYGRMITDEQLEEHLAAVRKGHWAPGLPAHTNGNNTDDLYRNSQEE